MGRQSNRIGRDCQSSSIHVDVFDWHVDQYQISTDKRSGIASDPKNPDGEKYIVHLVGQVVRVSVETVKIVNSLPAEYPK